MRRWNIAATLLVLALAIISTTFSILAATSKRWTVQQYFVGQGDATTFAEVVCEASRSPFYRCGIPRVDINGTCQPLVCSFFPPSGNNRTSCRVPFEVGDVFLQSNKAEGTIGTYSECQQVHFAGDLQIAASTFTGVGLLIAVVVSAANILLAFRPSREDNRADETRSGEQDDAAVQDTPQDAEHPRSHNAKRRHHVGSHHALGVTPYLASTLIAFLAIGAVLQLLAQFFGVLGLSLNNSYTPSAVTGAAVPDFENFGANEWTLDIALTRYATVAWVSAIVCACTVGMVSRGSRLRRSR